MYKWTSRVNRTQRKHLTETSGKVTVVTNAEKRGIFRAETNAGVAEERPGLAPRARNPCRSEPARSQFKTLLTLDPNSSVHKYLG